MKKLIIHGYRINGYEFKEEAINKLIEYLNTVIENNEFLNSEATIIIDVELSDNQPE